MGTGGEGAETSPHPPRGGSCVYLCEASAWHSWRGGPDREASRRAAAESNNRSADMAKPMNEEERQRLDVLLGMGLTSAEAA